MHTRGFTWIELAIVLVIVALLLVILVPIMRRHYTSSWSEEARAQCQDNLRQLVMAARMYAAEDANGYWPRLQGNYPWMTKTQARPSGCSGVFMRGPFLFAMQPGAIFPGYLTPPVRGRVSVLSCPSDNQSCAEAIPSDGPGPCQYDGFVTGADTSYFYLGYCLDFPLRQRGSQYPDVSRGNAPDVLLTQLPPQLAETFRQILPIVNTVSDDDGILEGDLTVQSPHGNDGSGTVYRLRGNLSRLTERDEDDVPVLWDQAATRDTAGVTLDSRVHVQFDRGSRIYVQFNHQPTGTNVAFMDGHVEFMQYGDRFPANYPWLRFSQYLNETEYALMPWYTGGSPP